MYVRISSYNTWKSRLNYFYSYIQETKTNLVLTIVPKNQFLIEFSSVLYAETEC
jgi:hypothetical protein